MTQYESSPKPIPNNPRNQAEDAAGAEFGPEAVLIMAEALESVCRALDITEDMGRERDIIVLRIIGLAQTGAIDARALHDRMLAELRSQLVNGLEAFGQGDSGR